MRRVRILTHQGAAIISTNLPPSGLDLSRARVRTITPPQREIALAVVHVSQTQPHPLRSTPVRPPHPLRRPARALSHRQTSSAQHGKGLNRVLDLRVRFVRAAVERARRASRAIRRPVARAHRGRHDVSTPRTQERRVRVPDENRRRVFQRRVLLRVVVVVVVVVVIRPVVRMKSRGHISRAFSALTARTGCHHARAPRARFHGRLASTSRSLARERRPRRRAIGGCPKVRAVPAFVAKTRETAHDARANAVPSDDERRADRGRRARRARVVDDVCGRRRGRARDAMDPHTMSRDSSNHHRHDRPRHQCDFSRGRGTRAVVLARGVTARPTVVEDTGAGEEKKRASSRARGRSSVVVASFRSNRFARGIDSRAHPNPTAIRADRARARGSASASASAPCRSRAMR